ncbi:chalcone isomerase family protein [Ideonella sp.]|uniref:chalcone isomerase family protein n=1 Tax=Ideonella sp. TaxID=1929293 RepID=UPI0035B00B66
MRRRAVLPLPLLLAAPPLPGTAAHATPAPDLPEELRGEWPGAVLAQPQGRSRMRVFGLAIYDIALWAPQPVTEAAELPGQPLALSLTYLRALDGRRIAERSLVEMRRGGPVDAATATRWLATMAQLFPDVAEGDRLTGVLRPGSGARFHLNGRPRGDWPDPAAAARFFGIWLAPWTSAPDLRRALLGGSP